MKMTGTIETSVERAPLAEQRLLLQEFSHRIVNELSCAMSVLSAAEARCNSTEAKTALGQVQDRLRSFASVEHSLQMPQELAYVDATAHIRQLCQAISRSKLADRGIELFLSDHPCRMSSERCWILGLILSELITNAAKHAFADRPGAIRIELHPLGTSFQCRVSDDGASETKTHRGQGSRIVEALARHLGGTVESEFRTQGSNTVLIFPKQP
jgi:two-component sensor histidine kinase